LLRGWGDVNREDDPDRPVSGREALNDRSLANRAFETFLEVLIHFHRAV